MTFQLTQQQAQYVTMQLSKLKNAFSLQKSNSPLDFLSQITQHRKLALNSQHQRAKLIQQYLRLKKFLGKQSCSFQLEAQKIKQIRQKGTQKENQQIVLYLKNLNKNKKTKKGLKILQKVLEDLMANRKQNIYFVHDVNFMKMGLPSYRKIIQRPVSLQKISKNLQNQYYERFVQAQYDLASIVTNSMIFNYQNSDMIKATLKYQRNYLKSLYKNLKLNKYFTKKNYEEVDIEEELDKLVQVQQVSQTDSIFQQNNQTIKIDENKIKKQNKRRTKRKNDKKINERKKTYFQSDIINIRKRATYILQDSVASKKLIPFLKQFIVNRAIDLKQASHEQLQRIQSIVSDCQKYITDNQEKKSQKEANKAKLHKRIIINQNESSQQSDS